jgi:hypothetical protein
MAKAIPTEGSKQTTKRWEGGGRRKPIQTHTGTHPLPYVLHEQTVGARNGESIAISVST